MSQFTDNENRSWTLQIDIPAARRIRKELHVDILDWDEGLPKLARDPILLCDVLWLLVAGQAETQGVSDEDFGRALAGQPLDDACDAFMAALIHFSPPRQREILTALQETGLMLTEQVADMAQETMETVQQIRGGRSSPAGKPSPASGPREPSAS